MPCYVTANNTAGVQTEMAYPKSGTNIVRKIYRLLKPQR